MNADLEVDDEALRCPLCGEERPANRLDADRSLYDVEAHGACGHFIVSRMAATRIATEPAANRRQYQRFIQAQNARGLVPRL